MRLVCLTRNAYLLNSNLLTLRSIALSSHATSIAGYTNSGQQRCPRLSFATLIPLKLTVWRNLLPTHLHPRCRTPVVRFLSSRCPICHSCSSVNNLLQLGYTSRLRLILTYKAVQVGFLFCDARKCCQRNHGTSCKPLHLR